MFILLCPFPVITGLYKSLSHEPLRNSKKSKKFKTSAKSILPIQQWSTFLSVPLSLSHCLYYSLSSFHFLSCLRFSLTLLPCWLFVSSVSPFVQLLSHFSWRLLDSAPFTTSHKQCVRCMKVTGGRRHPIKSTMHYYFTARPCVLSPTALQII